MKLEWVSDPMGEDECRCYMEDGAPRYGNCLRALRFVRDDGVDGLVAFIFKTKEGSLFVDFSTEATDLAPAFAGLGFTAAQKLPDDFDVVATNAYVEMIVRSSLREQ